MAMKFDLGKIEFNKKILVLGGAILFILAIFLFSSFEKEEVLVCPENAEISTELLKRIETIGQGNSYKDLQLLSQELRCRIRAIGAQDAYDELEQLTLEYERELVHDFGHEFGAALYQEEGLNGFIVCDERYFGGCTHEFLGSVIADRGVRGVDDLWKHCATLYKGESASCQHGIGHGLISYFGYEGRDPLIDSLAICRKFADNDDITGCDGGAYMEYNLRTMIFDEPSKELREDDWYEPCDWLGESYVDGCYHWLPQLWWINLGEQRPGEDKGLLIKFMAEKCEAIEGIGRVRCLIGLGMLIPDVSGYNGNRARELCEGIPNIDSSFICKAWAANTMMSVEGDSPQNICLGLTGARYDYCFYYGSSAGPVREMLRLDDIPLDF